MLCNNDSYETIENLEECELAAATLNLVFKEKEDSTGYPMGCYYFSTDYSSSSYTGVYFNINAGNEAHEFSQQICQLTGTDIFNYIQSIPKI